MKNKIKEMVEKGGVNVIKLVCNQHPESPNHFVTF